jgi:hypothetical protein
MGAESVGFCDTNVFVYTYTVLWTEDLSDGQTYGGVVARNPCR